MNNTTITNNLFSLVSKAHSSSDTNTCPYKTRGPWSVLNVNGKFGLLHEDGSVVVPPLFNNVAFEHCVDERAMVEGRGFWFEVLLDTYNGESVGVRRLINDKEYYFFINLGGRIILSLDEHWFEEQSKMKLTHFIGDIELPLCPPFIRISRIAQGFINGIAVIEVNSDDYFCERLEIDINGTIIKRHNSVCLQEPDDTDGRDFLDPWPGEFGCSDENEELYYDAFEGDPGAEWNID